MSNGTYSSMRKIIDYALPYRAHHWLRLQHNRYLKKKWDYRIRFTPPITSGAQPSDFEIHSLLGHRHVGMCLWSVKSLLNCLGEAYSVVLHDDGSLNEHDVDRLRRHLPGVTIILRQDADAKMAQMTLSFPNVRRYRFGQLGKTEQGRRRSVFSLKLLDFNMLTDSTKILVLDTDVLFFKKPLEIVSWIDGVVDEQCLYCYEEYRPILTVQGTLIGFEEKHEPQCYFNSGLICFNKNVFDLSVLERWLSDNEDLIDKQYTFEQSAYNYLVQYAGNSGPLPSTYSFNFRSENCVATHFGRKELFFLHLGLVQKTLTKGSTSGALRRCSV